VMKWPRLVFEIMRARTRTDRSFSSSAPRARVARAHHSPARLLEGVGDRLVAIEPDPELGGSTPARTRGVGAEVASAVAALFGFRTDRGAASSSTALDPPKRRRRDGATYVAMGTDDGAKGAAAGGSKASTGGTSDAKAAASDDASLERVEDSAGGKARFVHTLWRATSLAKIYYSGDHKVRARTLLAGMLFMCATTTALMVVFSYVQRDMMTALSNKDKEGFYEAIYKYLGVIAIAAPLFAMYQYVQDLVALEWRLWLTRLLVREYFGNDAYFKLKAEGSMDNPDQRICDDTRNFVNACNAVLLAFVQKILSMGAFFGVLYGISPNLLYFCFAYSLFGTIVTTKFFGARLMGLHYQALRREATMRFGLVRAREHAESIALYRGAKREAANARAALASVAAVMYRRVAWIRNLTLFTNAYDFATFCLPSLIIAPRYFAGEVEFGVVTQAGFAFRTVQSALNIIINNFETLSGLAAETDRLEKLLALLSGLSKQGGGGGGGGGGSVVGGGELELSVAGQKIASSSSPGLINRVERVSDDPNELMSLKDVSVRTPITDRLLWRGLTLDLKDGDSVLVVGPSGCGKSSLLRVVAGVWDSGSGDVVAPPRDDALFLPQTPYMPLGSLRAQLLFPAEIGDADATATAAEEVEAIISDASLFTDDDLLAALDVAGLGDLPSRFANEGGLDAVEEWTDVLSAGEQQRVAFARLFLRHPSVAFLDEATSALDERNESRMYASLKKHCSAYVSVGHRSTLLAFHSHVLRFVAATDGGGSWVLERAEEYEKTRFGGGGREKGGGKGDGDGNGSSWGFGAW